MAREIEQVLFTHPGIREASVVGLPDPTWGEIVAAVFVPSQPDRVPKPRNCTTSALPITGSGKIQKFRLRDQIDRAEFSELPSERG